MRRLTTQILRVFLLTAIGAGAAGAATLTLSESALFGPPGTTVGWSFTIESTSILDGPNPITPWLLITFADFVPDSGSNPVGVFTPFITQLPNSNVVIGPDAGNGEINPWSQVFDQGLITGIGSYQINDFQSPGDEVLGEIELFYDTYRISPNDPSFDSIADTVAVGQIMSAPASVTVGQQPVAAPEPGAAWMLALAGCGLMAWRSGRGQRSPDR